MTKMGRRKFDRTVVKKCPICGQQMDYSVWKAGHDCSILEVNEKDGYFFTKQLTCKDWIHDDITTIPVACRYCSCGHQFATRVRSSSSTSSITEERGEGDQGSNESTEGKRRRTVRTKRVRPDFFNSLDLEYTTRQIKNKKSKDDEESPKKKRGRPKGSVNKVKSIDSQPSSTDNGIPVEEDVFAGVSQEKLNTYNIILSELNRKISTQAFKPV